MNQDSSFIKRQSYGSPNYSNNPYANKDQFRYSTQTYPRTTSAPTRRYATLEESEAVSPVFTTPTNMYRQYTQSPQQQQQAFYNYSNQQIYNRDRNHTPPYNPAYSTQQFRQPVQEIIKEDAIVAQLVDMGFDISQSKWAVDTTGTNNLQDALDLLIQTSNKAHPRKERQTNSRMSTPPVPEKNVYTTTGYSTPPQPPPHDATFLRSPYSKNMPQKNHSTSSSISSHQESYATPPTPLKTASYRDSPSLSSFKTSQQTHAASPLKTPSQQSYFFLSSNNNSYSSTPSSPMRNMPQQNHPSPPLKNSPQPNYPSPPPKDTTAPGKAASSASSTPSFSSHNISHSPPDSDTETKNKQTASKIDIAITNANTERKQGNFSFSKGQYRESELSYTLAINALPSGHGDIPLLLNNRAAALIKQGKYKECLRDCALAIEIASKNPSLMTPIMQETNTTMKAQWVKAVHRKACALEGLKQYQQAMEVYEEYGQLEGSNHAQVVQGISRCKKAILLKTTDAKPIWAPVSDEINQSKAVQEMRERERKKEAEEAEKLLKEDKVNAQISMWKNGKDKNLRALLSSLDLILWSGVQWKSVTLAELSDPKRVKVAYMKAIAKVHPDKLSSNSTIEQRMLASNIFTTLNQAWDSFKLENNL